MADNAPACWGRRIKNITPVSKSWAEFAPIIAPTGERLAACERELGLTSCGLTLMQRLEAIEWALFGAARTGVLLDRLAAAESAAGLSASRPPRREVPALAVAGAAGLAAAAVAAAWKVWARRPAASPAGRL